MRRWFWPLVLAAMVLTAAASASLTFAYVNRDYDPPSSDFWNRATHPPTPSSPLAESLRASARGLEDPLPWLIAGIVLALMALLVLALAVRSR